MYNGDPHNVSAREVLGRYRENPKSATLRVGRAFVEDGGTRRRFCGLRSRWMRFLDRRNRMADATIRRSYENRYRVVLGNVSQDVHLIRLHHQGGIVLALLPYQDHSNH